MTTLLDIRKLSFDMVKNLQKVKEFHDADLLDLELLGQLERALESFSTNGTQCVFTRGSGFVTMDLASLTARLGVDNMTIDSKRLNEQDIANLGTMDNALKILPLLGTIINAKR